MSVSIKSNPDVYRSECPARPETNSKRVLALIQARSAAPLLVKLGTQVVRMVKVEKEKEIQDSKLKVVHMIVAFTVSPGIA